MVCAQTLPVWSVEDQRYREAYLNAKLAHKCAEPEVNPWAALDFAGIEFPPDACAKYMLRYQQVCVSVCEGLRCDARTLFDLPATILRQTLVPRKHAATPAGVV